jgi:hypothetical protein
MYAWMIDKDHTADPGSRPGTNSNAVGMMGPRGMSDHHMRLLVAGQGAPFRMLDDDGELYYEGRFIGDIDDEEAFGPLDDFGMPNAGATSILYLRNGIWEQL